MSSEKAMAPHSSTLAWRVPWTEEPGGLQSMGSQRVGHDWATSLYFTHFSHPCMTTGKTIGLIRLIFVGSLCWLLFNMLSRLVIAFLPSSNHLLISRLQSLSAVILKLKKIKSVTVAQSICHEGLGLEATILVFWMVSFKSNISLSSLTFINWLLSSSLLSAIRVVSSASEVIDISPSNLDSSLCFFQPSVSHDVLCC